MTTYTPSPPVTYAQAVKLKLLGFDAPVRLYFAMPPETKDTRLVGGDLSNHNSRDSRVSAPSQNEAADWLRQVKGVICAPVASLSFTPSKEIWIPSAIQLSDLKEWCNNSCYCQNYTEALSVALDEALNNIP